MDDDAALRNAVEWYLKYSPADEDKAHEIYHEDAVLEFPQSGERFEGVDNFRTWRRDYPAKIEYRIRRITSGGSIAVAELSIRYDEGPWMFGVSINEFRGDKVVHERIYVMDGWEAAEWRAPWRSATPADPPVD